LRSSAQPVGDVEPSDVSLLLPCRHLWLRRGGACSSGGGCTTGARRGGAPLVARTFPRAGASGCHRSDQSRRRTPRPARSSRSPTPRCARASSPTRTPVALHNVAVNCSAVSCLKNSSSMSEGKCTQPPDMPRPPRTIHLQLPVEFGLRHRHVDGHSLAPCLISCPHCDVHLRRRHQQRRTIVDDRLPPSRGLILLASQAYTSWWHGRCRWPASRWAIDPSGRPVHRVQSLGDLRQRSGCTDRPRRAVVD